jgi:hypothetical protein
MSLMDQKRPNNAIDLESASQPRADISLRRTKQRSDRLNPQPNADIRRHSMLCRRRRGRRQAITVILASPSISQ